MPGLYAVEVEPEVRSWLERLSDRDFGRADFLVGLLAEHAETLGEPYTVTSAGKYANCGSTCWPSNRASPTGSRQAAGSSCSPCSARPGTPRSPRWPARY